MTSALHHVTGLARAVGWPTTLDVLARRLARTSQVVVARVRGQPEPIEINPIDSDLFVMSQVFGWKEYDPGPVIVDKLRHMCAVWESEGITPLIVDGGSNVGYSALFFAQTYPLATVIAAEPDAKTFEALRRNCAKRTAVKPVRTALWTHGDGVNFQSERQGSWSHHVGAEGVSVPSTTLQDLVAGESPYRLLILKLDVEGAEREIVKASPEIVRSAMCIMIEPHDFMSPGSSCLDPLFEVLAGQRFDTVLSGENLFFFSPELNVQA